MRGWFIYINRNTTTRDKNHVRQTLKRRNKKKKRNSKKCCVKRSNGEMGINKERERERRGRGWKKGEREKVKQQKINKLKKKNIMKV